MTSQSKHWNYYGAQVTAYDVTTQKFANLLDVSSLGCKTKVLNGPVPGIWKWTIEYLYVPIYSSLK